MSLLTHIWSHLLILTLRSFPVNQNLFTHPFSRFTAHSPLFHLLLSSDHTSPIMTQPTAQQKHDILIHCQSRRYGETEVQVAARHGVKITRKTIWNWQQKWNGTSESLEHQPVSGRPRTFTPTEVHRYIRQPIRSANRSHSAISYTQLLPKVQQKTKKKFSLRTLQRTGQKQLNIKSKHTRKRTRAESQCTQTFNESKRFLLAVK